MRSLLLCLLFSPRLEALECGHGGDHKYGGFLESPAQFLNFLTSAKFGGVVREQTVLKSPQKQMILFKE